MQSSLVSPTRVGKTIVIERGQIQHENLCTALREMVTARRSIEQRPIGFPSSPADQQSFITLFRTRAGAEPFK
jgi:hypothetical protein